MAERRIETPAFIIRGIGRFESIRLPSLIDLGKYYHEYLSITDTTTQRRSQLDTWLDFSARMFKVFTESLKNLENITYLKAHEKSDFIRCVRDTMADILSYCRNGNKYNMNGLIVERTYYLGSKSATVLVAPLDRRMGINQDVTIFFLLCKGDGCGFYIDKPTNISTISNLALSDTTPKQSKIREELSHLNDISRGKTLVLKLEEDAYNRLIEYSKYIGDLKNNNPLTSSETLMQHIITSMKDNKKVLILEGTALTKYEHNKVTV